MYLSPSGLGPSGNDLIGSEWKSSNDRKKILDRQRTWSGRKSENNVASIGEETNRLVYNQSGLVTTLFSLKTIPQDDMVRGNIHLLTICCVWFVMTLYLTIENEASRSY